MTAKWFKITVITLHPPTEDSEADTKDRWYGEVQEVLNKVPGHNMLIILGDMNAKIGKEIAAFTGTIGTHSLHENSNDNGIRLATLATEYNLVVKCTLFPHKEKHKGTWLSPNGNTTNQIDHILVKRKFRSVLMDVRAYRGADCDSDHYMVAAKMRIKLITKRKNGGQTAKIDTEKPKEEETRLQYQVEVENIYAALEVDDDVS
ncbi:craniofacial development protein 2-like [Macrobrachium nipponense]|uniref:craniofacial development protein 2-like n=1 Tax=Macrobrachium nipponense TaxID=159736 RepID=UPI0030C84E7A